MAEWIIDAPSPTRAMERMRTGGLTRCADCAHCEHVGELCYCERLLMYVPPRGFCWMGEREDR